MTSTLLTGIVLSGIDRWTWHWWNIAGAAALFLIIAHRWLRALRWSGIRLEPDGVRYQQIRTRFIPWQAAPELVTPARNPDAATAVLQPGNRKIRPTLAPSYLAAAIREYVAHPEHRTTLDTTTELARITALLSPRSGVPRTDRRSNARIAARRACAGCAVRTATAGYGIRNQSSSRSRTPSGE
jgi:hypothetical protein